MKRRATENNPFSVRHSHHGGKKASNLVCISNSVRLSNTPRSKRGFVSDTGGTKPDQEKTIRITIDILTVLIAVFVILLAKLFV